MHKIIYTSAVILVLVAAFFWLQYAFPHVQQDLKQITTFKDCAAAGYPIVESYPRQCRTPDGRMFVEEIETTPEAVFCTMDAMQCPDGSYVGRVGPRCEFAACPAGSSQTPSASLEPTPSPTPPPPGLLSGGIRGMVVIGPTCPVLTDPAQSNCDDRPYETELLLSRPDGTAVMLFNSDGNGEFMLTLAPGAYHIQDPGNGSWPHCSAEGPIMVRENEYVSARVYCDSGLR